MSRFDIAGAIRTPVTLGSSATARGAAPVATSPSSTNGTEQAARARVEVWDMSSGIEQLVTGPALLGSEDPIIAQAYAQAQRVDAFLRDRFGRNGIDGHGTPVRIVVHAPNEDGSPNMNNAYWDNATKRIYLGDGDGEFFAPLGGAFDVLVHEATHGIVDASVQLKYEGQQGAINESFADVIGAVADPEDWRIGEDIFTPGTDGDEIRDLEHPEYSNTSQLPAAGIEVDVHKLSGIPSLAAVRVAETIGRREMGDIWFTALTKHLTSRSGFSGAARATLEAAAELHGRDSTAVQAVMDAWKSVGVDPRWRPDAKH